MSYANTYTHQISDPPLADAPKPPTLHWIAVLVATLVTFGLFQIFWMLRQAWWVKRIDGEPQVFYGLALAVPVAFLLCVGSVSGRGDLFEVLPRLVLLGGSVIIVYFDMKATVEARYRMRLSGPMTVLFNVYYLRRIARGEHVEYPDPLITSGSPARVSY